MISPTQLDDTVEATPPQAPQNGADEIHVFLADIVFGPYSRDKIQKRIDEGLLTLDDLARRHESEEWSPLRNVLEAVPPAPEASAPEAAAPEPPEVFDSAPISVPMSRFASIPTPGVTPTEEPTEEEPEVLTEPVTPIRPPTVPLPPVTPPAEAVEEKPKPEPQPAPRITGVIPILTRSRSSIMPPERPVDATKKMSGIRAQILARTSKEPLKLPTQEPARNSLRLRNPATTAPLPAISTSSKEISLTSLAPATSGSKEITFPSIPKLEAEKPVETPVPPPVEKPKEEPIAEAPKPALSVETPKPAPAKADLTITSRPKSRVMPRLVLGGTRIVPAVSATAALPKVATEPPAEGAKPLAPAMPGTEASKPVTPMTPSPVSSTSKFDRIAGPSSPPAHSGETVPLRTLPSSINTGPLPAVATPATRTVSVAALASGALPTPEALAAARTPLKPAAQRPEAATSSLSVRLPARKSQMLMPMPERPVTETGRARPSIELSHVPRPTHTVTDSPVESTPEPARTPAAFATLASVATAAASSLEEEKKAEANAPLPGPTANFTRTRTATTTKLSRPAGEEPPASDTPPLPGSVAFTKAPATAAPAATEPAKGPTSVLEKRHVLRKQRLQRRRLLFIFLGMIVVLILVVAALLYFASHGAQVEKLPDVPVPAPPPVVTPAANPTPAPTTNAVVPAPAPATAPTPAPATPPATSMANPPETTPPTPAAPETPAPASPAPPAAAATSSVPTPAPAPVPATDPKIVAIVTEGLGKQSKGDLAGAIDSFTEALQLNPKYIQGFSYRAAARQAKGDLDGAIMDDDSLLTIDPHNAGGYCQRGFLKQSKGDPDGAIADYTCAIQFDPKAFIAYYNRGLIEEQKGNFDGAIADYNQTLTLSPQLAGAYYNRGNAKTDKADLDGAIADYTRALELNPKIALAYCNRALAEQNSMNLDAAFADYNQALAIDPTLAIAFYNRGLIKEQRNDLDGSISDSSKAILLNGKNAQAFYNRGVALQAKGNLDAAGNDLRKFIELAPKDSYADYARLYLWVLTSQQGKKDQADKELSGVIDSTWNAEPAQLPSKIASYLLSHIDETELMSVASSSTDPKKDQGQHCEAWYFVGVKKLLANDKAGAIDAFHRCLDTGQKDFCEYILAQAQLQVLGNTAEN